MIRIAPIIGTQLLPRLYRTIHSSSGRSSSHRGDFHAEAIALLSLVALSCVAISQHKQRTQDIQVTWINGQPQIRTQRLLLRPIQESDLPIYQSLFSNPKAMEKYLGGVRDITARFHGWLGRWKMHCFSALAVVDRKTQTVIGHVVSGHGDYEGSHNEKGWSEVAVVIDPARWDTHFTVETEVVRASVAYARALHKRGIRVPSDVAPKHRAEVEAWILKRPDLKVHRNTEGQIDWIYLPFSELRSTAHRENPAGHGSLKQVFQKENQATVKPHSDVRDLFSISL
jgi:RimJ/RimL family protein N-acetyltransferase